MFKGNSTNLVEVVFHDLRPQSQAIFHELKSRPGGLPVALSTCVQWCSRR